MIRRSTARRAPNPHFLARPFEMGDRLFHAPTDTWFRADTVEMDVRADEICVSGTAVLAGTRVTYPATEDIRCSWERMTPADRRAAGGKLRNGPAAVQSGGGRGKIKTVEAS